MNVLHGFLKSISIVELLQGTNSLPCFIIDTSCLKVQSDRIKISLSIVTSNSHCIVVNCE